MPLTTADDTVELIRMKYAELPGLKLTFRQAQRLWNLPSDECARALTTLTGSRFLTRTSEEVYVRGVLLATSRAPVRPEGTSGQRT